MVILWVIGVLVLAYVYSAMSAGTYIFLKEQAPYVYPISASYRKTTIIILTSAVAPPFLLMSLLGTLPFLLAMGLAKLVGLYW